jgi:hypothetical protein
MEYVFYLRYTQKYIYVKGNDVPVKGKKGKDIPVTGRGGP